jgi:Ca-activated chloride channel homolog
MDWNTLKFLEPHFLWLLVVPALLTAVCLYRIWARAIEVRCYTALRLVPIRELPGFFGATLFYLALAISVALAIAASARPQVVTSASFYSGNRPIDLLILQDGSASTLVQDIFPNRWQRSFVFLRTLTSRLRWKGDRVALAIFAKKVSPQAYLTSDPNVLLFSFDHLAKAPPFLPHESNIWETYIGEGIHWAMKTVQKDRKDYGDDGNPKAIVVISDGQSENEDVSQSVQEARAAGIPIYAIGVGTVRGGCIPDAEKYQDDHQPVCSAFDTGLDRKSLQNIASSGGYFEIGQESDQSIADRIITLVRSSYASRNGKNSEKMYQDVYWQFLLLGAMFFLSGLLTLIK